MGGYGSANLAAIVRTGILVIGTFGCASADSDRLQQGKPTAGMTGDLDDGTVPDAGQDAGGAGSGGAGAGGAGAGGSGGGAGDVGADCVPNPGDEVCPEICPEICNNQDDDCDLRIDEGEANDSCQLDNAVSACIKGACIVAKCDDDFRDCDNIPENGCEAGLTDPDNCGSCGTVCGVINGTPTCDNGSCALLSCDDLWGNCDDNSADCETATTSLSNCGGCGLPCEGVPNATDSCAMGFCGPGECSMGYGDCNTAAGDGCEATLDSLQNCTGCDVACAFTGSTNDCSAGTCVAVTCDQPDYEDCDKDLSDGCESLDDALTCGSCDTVCDTALPNVAGASCAAKSCTITCASGFGDCNGEWTDGCEVALVTNTHCGQCDTACSFPDGAGDCSSGTCTLSDCDPGFGNCDSNESNGCETNTNEDQANCGGCVPGSGSMCPASGTPFCVGGNCSAISCSAPMADCALSGTECLTNLSNDPAHCGACDNSCAFDPGDPHASLTGCSDSNCTISCASGYEDCDGNYKNGCEQALNDNQNCGACGVTCTQPNAAATCASGSCQIASCNTDFEDCGPGAGCETPINTTDDCGSCNNECDFPGAIGSCGGSPGSRSCQIAGCSESYLRDCPPNSVGDGCETDVRADDGNCGACNNDCDSHANVQNSSSCSAGTCSYSCDTGFKACDSDPNNGCDTSIRTAGDCGDCGVMCARNNGSASCDTGSCQLTGCNGGFDNCDGNDANGCEALTSLTHCGGCNMACNLANASETCNSGGCAIVACDAGFDDCDGNPANGCERDLNALGPCFPDTNCTRATHDGRDYFFCRNNSNWTSAQTKCQTQLLGGDLVTIDDSAENTFVLNNVSENSWIGANDRTTEDAWVWAKTDDQFWQGEENGSVVGGLYNNWSNNEPNDSSNEDCAEIGSSSGQWNDLNCGETRDFVCELAGDLCPGDPSKLAPGQCGCGSPDTDTDIDGTADCVDLCPTDPAKVAAGQCGCGNSDADDDMDDTANCNDLCPQDGDKTAPGICDCGTPDTDSDGDGTEDCDEECPFDASRTAAPCGFGYTVSNFDLPAVDFGPAPDSTLNCGTTTIDTTGSVTITNWCGTAPVPVIQNQVGGSGPQIVVIPLKGLTLDHNPGTPNILRLIGDKPVVLAVEGSVTINGTIDASAVGGTPGAGGNVSCSGGVGSNGSSSDGNGGGGGGGFGAGGGSGGKGGKFLGTNNGGSGGGTEGAAGLVPLRGGCVGGKGGNGGNGGAGGGAVQITASGLLLVGANGVVTSSGGGGLKGGSSRDGGGGGGSGGGVLLEAGSLQSDAGGWATANGGGGGEGTESGNADGAPGTDGFSASSAQAPGGSGDSGGNGGKGGAADGGATNGGSIGASVVPGVGMNGGGGGGGGVGRIRIRGINSCALAGSASPGASVSCP